MWRTCSAPSSSPAAARPAVLLSACSYAELELAGTSSIICTTYGMEYCHACHCRLPDESGASVSDSQPFCVLQLNLLLPADRSQDMICHLLKS